MIGKRITWVWKMNVSPFFLGGEAGFEWDVSPIVTSLLLSKYSEYIQINAQLSPLTYAIQHKELLVCVCVCAFQYTSVAILDIANWSLWIPYNLKLQASHVTSK